MRVFRRPIHAGLVMVALSAMLIAGCGHHAARVNAPVAPARIGSTETGVASWYGVPYDGRRAASGEIYDMRQLTAAHRQLPFQTWVEVTNLSNGKQVDVRINDRGPFVKGRIVDLSQAAARDIDMLRAGTARVRLKVIPPPVIMPAASSRTPPDIPIERAAARAAARTCGDNRGSRCCTGCAVHRSAHRRGRTSGHSIPRSLHPRRLRDHSGHGVGSERRTCRHAARRYGASRRQLRRASRSVLRSCPRRIAARRSCGPFRRRPRRAVDCAYASAMARDRWPWNVSRAGR